MNRNMLNLFRWMLVAGVALVVAFTAASSAAMAQTAIDGQSGAASLWVGIDYANLKAGFPIDSTVRQSGVGVFATYNISHSLGLEAHARFRDLNSWYGETQQDYLIGPRYTFLRREKLRPYALFEVGAVKIQYPFQMGTGTSFAMAPGGGLEYRLGLRLSAHVAYQYQILTNSPDFTDEPSFGIRPNGFTVGVAYRLFSRR